MTGGGKFTFHFGVDIWAPNGTAVYPVVSGTVGRVSHEKHREYVEILTGNGRSFEYWHMRAVVRPGQRVRGRCHRARHDHGAVRARPFRRDQERTGGEPACLRSSDALHRHDQAESRVDLATANRDRLRAPTELRPAVVC